MGHTVRVGGIDYFSLGVDAAAAGAVINCIWQNNDKPHLGLGGIVAKDEKSLVIYTHSGADFTKKNIKKAFHILFENIIAIKVEWFFGYMVSFQHVYKQQAYELKLRFYKRTKRLESQKEEVVRFIKLLKGMRDEMIAKRLKNRA